MIAVDHKSNWMQIPYNTGAIPNNAHLPPPPSLNAVPASSASMQAEMKPYIGEDSIAAAGQMSHLARPMAQNSTGHSHNSNSGNAASKAAQDRVKRPMNAFMVSDSNSILYSV